MTEAQRPPLALDAYDRNWIKGATGTYSPGAVTPLAACWSLSGAEHAATFLTALAALVTVYLARQTVKEARATRGEEEQARRVARIERVGELAHELANAGDRADAKRIRNAQILLGVALAPFPPGELPKARELRGLPESSSDAVADKARETLDEVRLALEASVREAEEGER